MWRYCLLVLVVTLAGCGGAKTVSEDDYHTQEVTLPDATVIRAERMVHPMDMMRGMMFRDSLANDRGMLFIHGEAGMYPYWMYQVKIPLDIIWMDKSQTVVEISANTPPCPSKSSSDCPQFGGHERAQFVLELNAGAAAKHGVVKGTRINF